MTREIKFRAWSEKEKSFIWYGILIDWINNWRNKKLIKSLIFQQFAGLRDKNGVEIYEGDIVNIYDDANLEILDVDVFEYNFNGFWLKDWDCECGLPNPGNLEVIGNIFENPELLNVCE